MNEDEGEGHSGKNDEDTSEEEEGNPYDIDDYEKQNKKPSKGSNPVHDSIHKDFMDLLREIKQVKDFKSNKHHWMSGRQKPLSKLIDEVRIIF